MKHATTLAAFCGDHSSHSRFASYKGKQRALATAANIVLGGGKKYNRPRQLSQQQVQPQNMTKLRRNRRHRKAKAKCHRQGRQLRATAAAAPPPPAMEQTASLMPPPSQQDDSSFGFLDDDVAIAALDATDVTALPPPVDPPIHDAHRAQNPRTTTMRPRKRQFHGRNRISQSIPVVAFGGALIAKDASRIRGLAVGRSTMVLRHLFDRQLRGLVMTVVTNEFRTSRTCAHCHMPVQLALRDGRSIFGSVICQTCRQIIDRNANAATNMAAILHSQSLVGRRPVSMTRPPRAQQQPPPPQRRRRHPDNDNSDPARPARRHRANN